eukprot:GHVT01072491.1.p1 GENE.GHVT01072491.1~~GHVT01072491.1.p1  ORF type:complete len:342 (+),score=78.35 GHVT01072491.1:56-1081(+)
MAKGTRKNAWRKIDTSDAHAAIATEQQRKVHAAAPDKLFVVDTEGGAILSHRAAKLVRKPLDGRKRAPSHSKSHLRQIERTAKNLGLLKKQQQGQAGQAPAKDAFDVWGDDVPMDAPACRGSGVSAKALWSGSRALPKPRLAANVPPVKAPHPGQSYNPSATDYDAIISEAAGSVVRQEQEARRIEAQMTPLTSQLLLHLPPENVAKLSDKQKQRLLFLLMSKGKIVADDAGDVSLATEEEAQDQDDADVASDLRKLGRGKKTKAQRNKEARFAASEKETMLKRAKKAFRRSFEKLDVLLSDVMEKERISREAKVERNKSLKAEIDNERRGIVRPQRIGKV